MHGPTIRNQGCKYLTLLETQVAPWRSGGQKLGQRTECRSACWLAKSIQRNGANPQRHPLFTATCSCPPNHIESFPQRPRVQSINLAKQKKKLSMPLPKGTPKHDRGGSPPVSGLFFAFLLVQHRLASKVGSEQLTQLSNERTRGPNYVHDRALRAATTRDSSDPPPPPATAPPTALTLTRGSRPVRSRRNTRRPGARPRPKDSRT